MITRDETPFMSSIGKTKATSVYHEWQTDTLQAPRNSRVQQGADFDNVLPDGEDGSDNSDTTAFTVPNRTRLGNYTQINAKTVAVSGTKRAVDQTGVADEYAYQLKKRGTEMRRDIENDLINTLNIASSGGQASTITPGSFAGVFSWATNISDAGVDISTGTGIHYSAPSAANRGLGSQSGTVDVASTSNDVGDLELENIDEIMQTIYEEGGKAGRVMLSPKNRRVFSQKAQAAGATAATGAGSVGNVRRNVDDSGKLTQAVSIYMSDFGEIMVEPNYIMGLGTLAAKATSAANGGDGIGQHTALVYDPMWFKIATLRPMQEVDVGQRGDSTVGMFVEECTLEVTNPNGWGIITNIGA